MQAASTYTGLLPLAFIPLVLRHLMQSHATSAAAPYLALTSKAYFVGRAVAVVRGAGAPGEVRGLTRRGVRQAYEQRV